MIDNFEMTADQRAQVWVYSGLLDLMLGLIILGFGLGIVSDMVWMGGILLPVMLPSLIAAQKSFAARIPAAARVPQGADRLLMWLGLILLGLLALGVGVAFTLMFDSASPQIVSIRAWLSDHMTIVMSLIWVLLLLPIGGIVRRSRFVAYAAAAMAIGAATQALTLPFGLAPLLTGGLIMLAGLGVMISFLRAYPKSDNQQ